MEQIHIAAAARSPIGKFGGGLKDIPIAELGAVITRAIVPESAKHLIEEVILGQVLQAGSGMNVSRQIALKVGIPNTVPAYTVNMACGSSLKAVALAAATLRETGAPLALAGGVEVMSAAPYLLPNLRWGQKLGDSAAIDSIQNDGLTDPTLRIGMGETAERIADLLRISREEQDAYAAESQARVQRHLEAFTREIVPVQTRPSMVQNDEHPRAETSVASLSKLRPVFRPDGSVTAGNASGINDGAAMVLLATETGLRATGLHSRARLIASATTGCDPATMGLGPVTAIQSVLQRAGWTADSVDLFEINEAFAAQALGCIRQLNLDPLRVNTRGGAIALGHPIGASGARILVTLLHAMEDTNARRGIASLCIGGGMGIAMAIER
jgi:acetyl-CoA C-acetyltransferase